MTAGEAERDHAPLRRDAARNVEKISTAAAAAFAERGLEVTMADVADRAGVGVGTVYRRFGDKHGLITALFEDKVHEVAEIAEAAKDRSGPTEALVELLVRCNELLAANKGLRQLLLSTAGDFEPRADALARLIAVVDALVADAKRAGWLRDSFAPSDFPILLIAVQAVRDLGGDTHPELWRRTLQVLVDGIRSDSRKPIDVITPPALSEEQTQSLMRDHKR